MLARPLTDAELAAIVASGESGEETLRRLVATCQDLQGELAREREYSASWFRQSLEERRRWCALNLGTARPTIAMRPVTEVRVGFTIALYDRVVGDLRPYTVASVTTTGARFDLSLWSEEPKRWHDAISLDEHDRVLVVAPYPRAGTS